MPHPLHEVLVVFASEAADQLREVTDSLIRADANISPEQRKAALQKIARHAHTIKGNSGAFGLDEVETLMHTLETTLEPWLKSGARLPEATSQLLLAAFDRVPGYIAAIIADKEATSLKPLIASFSGIDKAEQTADSLPLPPSAPQPSAPPPSAPPPPVEVMGEGADEWLRVSADRIGALDHMIADLRELRGVIDYRAEEAGRLRQRLDRPADDAEALRVAQEALHSLQRNLRADATELASRLAEASEELRAIRMLPVATLVAGLRRMLWEHGRAVGKRVELVTSGVELSLDRRAIEEVKDALLHLSRNSVDHGLENEAGRRAAGKPPVGQVSLSVEQRQGRAHILFSDDGQGVDLARVRELAIERGLLSADALAEGGSEALYEVLFAPGFSTARELSKTSGRGVGLNVVRDNLTRIGGSVRLESIAGKGTQFLLDVPLSVASAQALVVEAGGHRLALPLGSVSSSMLAPVANGLRTVEIGGLVMPVRSLAALLGLTEAPHARATVPVVVLNVNDRWLALAVDSIWGERDVVLRPIPPELAKLPGLSAATQLGDGQLAFVLSARALIEMSPQAGSNSGSAVTKSPLVRPRVIVCDDSLTTRTLHRQVLEAAGFAVKTAPDGEEAFRLVREQGADLIVSDVRMPRLDGLAFTRKIRADRTLAHIPVILISSLDTAEDRKRAEEAGVTAYVTKQSYQRGELVSIAKRLVGGT